MTDDVDDDAVLAALFEGEAEPRARDIIAAKKAHPHLAARIVEKTIARKAAILTASLYEQVESQPDPERIAALIKRAAAETEPPDLEALLASRSMTPAALANEVKLPFGIVRQLIDGACVPPLSSTAETRLAGALNVAPITLAAAFIASAESPKLGMAKSSTTPTVRQRTFRDIVEASPEMSAAQKAEWLAG